MSQGQPPCHIIAETLGGAFGGFAGGVLPDRIDTPECPRHRDSMALTGTIGWYVRKNLPEWQGRLRARAEQFRKMREANPSGAHQFFLLLAEYFCRFLAGLIAGVLAGYASHLTLDFFTPMSLPVF